jgi:hypothetical protein
MASHEQQRADDNVLKLVEKHKVCASALMYIASFEFLNKLIYMTVLLCAENG